MRYGTQLQSYLLCGPLCTVDHSYFSMIILCFKHQWATFCWHKQAPLLRLKSRIKRKLLYLLQSVMDTGSNFSNPEEGAEGRWPELQTTISVTSAALFFTDTTFYWMCLRGVYAWPCFSDNVGYNGALTCSSDVDVGESLTSRGRHKILFCRKISCFQYQTEENMFVNTKKVYVTCLVNIWLESLQIQRMLGSHDPQLLKQSSMTLTFNCISVYWEPHIYFCVPLNT